MNPKMFFLTESYLILCVSKRWDEQYSDRPDLKEKLAIGNQNAKGLKISPEHRKKLISGRARALRLRKGL